MEKEADPHLSGTSSRAALTLAALGVVYGDIGTSPLYAVKETFNPEHGIRAHARERPRRPVGDLLGADDRGLAEVRDPHHARRQQGRGRHHGAARARLVGGRRIVRAGAPPIMLLGVFGAALFYGDAVLTPAISVLSAVEGLEVGTAAFKPYVVPIAVGVVIGLFALQRQGTVGGRRAVRAGHGALVPRDRRTRRRRRSRSNPAVLRALDPSHALRFVDAARLRVVRRAGRRCCWPSPAPRRSTPTWATSARRRSASPGSGWYFRR